MSEIFSEAIQFVIEKAATEAIKSKENDEEIFGEFQPGLPEEAIEMARRRGMKLAREKRVPVDPDKIAIHTLCYIIDDLRRKIYRPASAKKDKSIFKRTES